MRRQKGSTERNKRPPSKPPTKRQPKKTIAAELKKDIETFMSQVGDQLCKLPSNKSHAVLTAIVRDRANGESIPLEKCMEENFDGNSVDHDQQFENYSTRHSIKHYCLRFNTVTGGKMRDEEHISLLQDALKVYSGKEHVSSKRSAQKKSSSKNDRNKDGKKRRNSGASNTKRKKKSKKAGDDSNNVICKKESGGRKKSAATESTKRKPTDDKVDDEVFIGTQFSPTT